jgi:proline iminopeptidase
VSLGRPDQPVDDTSVLADDGCRLWTAETGRGAALVICHGGPGLWDMSGTLAVTLAPHLRVIRWDQRGCGRSERRGPYSLHRSAADLDAVRRGLDLDRIAVLGHACRVVLPGASHVPWLDAPADFSAAVLDYLRA